MARKLAVYDAVGKYNVRTTALPIEVRSIKFKINGWIGWSNDTQTRESMRAI